jgi:hypothetical protein
MITEAARESAPGWPAAPPGQRRQQLSPGRHHAGIDHDHGIAVENERYRAADVLHAAGLAGIASLQDMHPRRAGGGKPGI